MSKTGYCFNETGYQITRFAGFLFRQRLELVAKIWANSEGSSKVASPKLEVKLLWRPKLVTVHFMVNFINYNNGSGKHTSIYIYIMICNRECKISIGPFDDVSNKSFVQWFLLLEIAMGNNLHVCVVDSFVVSPMTKYCSKHFACKLDLAL
jgi:hypothetical protein